VSHHTLLIFGLYYPFIIVLKLKIDSLRTHIHSVRGPIPCTTTILYKDLEVFSKSFFLRPGYFVYFASDILANWLKV